MVFLSHSVPWQTLASKLEYIRARSASGSHYGSIKFKQEPNQLAQLEYFARKFRDTVQEHGSDERNKYQAPNIYADRARDWKTSSESYEWTQTTSNDLSVGADEARIQRNLELRKLQDTFANQGPWSTATEHRMIYPADFTETYLNASHWSTRRKDHMSFLERQVGRTIQDWIALASDRAEPERQQERTYWGHSTDELEHADVIKLLVTDAVVARQPQRRRRTIETLFLLCHHPSVDLNVSSYQSMSCCNIHCGFDNMGFLAVKVFLLLNVLDAMHDAGVTKLFAPREAAVVYDKHVQREVTTKSHWRGPLDYVELLPRPTYMNLRIWSGLMTQVCGEHEYQAEKLIYSMVFYPPRESDGKPVEHDIFADRDILKGHLKTIWKVIITIHMVMREIRKPINWEFVVLDSLDALFGWLPEERFIDYRRRRCGLGAPDEEHFDQRFDFCRYERT